MPEPGQQRKTSSPGSPAVPSRKSWFTPYISPTLQAATGGTLFWEALAPKFAHKLTPQIFQQQMAQVVPHQVLLGMMQRNIGFLGAFYYGRKAYKEGDWKYGAASLGYSVFGAHGTSRMLQATNPHPQMTPFTGAVAAVTKATSQGFSPTAIPYIGDMFANIAELGHAMHEHVKQPGILRKFADMAHHVSAKTITRTQIGFGATMVATAMYDILKKRSEIAEYHRG